MWQINLRNIIISLCFLVPCFTEYIPPGPKYKCPSNFKQIFPCICLNGSDKGLYIRCENTNLASLSIAMNNIATFGLPVEHLTVFKCNFERLYGTIFFKTQARILTIQETPIKTIDQYSFYGINETLEELYIDNSQINEFPTKALKVLGKLKILSIDHQFIQSVEKDIFTNSSSSNYLEKITFSNGLLSEFPVESLQNLKKLKKIDLHGHMLTALKRNQFKNLRDVEILDISHNNLTKLEAHHIADLTKLSWCNVSHNALTEISRGTFARNSVLRVLNMSFNKIKKLDSNTFRGMRFLRRLYLSDNQISDIGRGTFSSITRIGTIDLARNVIKKIDYQMFAQLNYVEIIDVAENQITEIQKQSFKDLYLTHINISHNVLKIIEDRSFENCANITVLDLSFNQLNGLPKDTFDATTYATELILAHNFFSDMAQIPLHTMTGMKILNISFNNIENIPKNTFPKLYELHTIDVSHNNLTAIANAVLQPLFALRNLNISHNNLEEIKSPTFGTLPTLLTLDLSFNKLQTVARYSLVKLTSLRYLTLANNILENLFEIPISLNRLELNNNWIQNIPENTWPRMNSLLFLDLSGNRISDNLKSYSFTGLLTLQTLKLISNGITKAPMDGLNGLSTLQYLHLENNNITSLEKSAFGKLPVVFELNLQNNNINTIREHAFNGLLQLLRLNLSFNSIESIPNEAFFGLVSLKTLDLSHNYLDKLDNKTNGVLDKCLSLEKLNISHNKITYINRKTFPSDPYTPYRLSDIDLSYNNIPILTYDITFGTKKVKKLNLSNNLIGSIRTGVLSNLTALEVLDLSHNKLEDLKSTEVHFKLPPRMSHIYLQYNQIINIPTYEFFKLKNLSELDFTGNKMETFSLDFVNMLYQKVHIKYSDNPLNCDCKLRPLYYYFSTLTKIPLEFQELRCDSPARINGRNLFEITDDQLQCVTNSEDDLNHSYAVMPDIKFRNVLVTRGNLLVRWFVTPNRDIADFYISLRNEENVIHYDKHLPYDARNATIPLTMLEKFYETSKWIQFCVFSKNSLDLIKQWVETQCVHLPEKLKSSIRKYNENTNDVYTIISDKAAAITSDMKTNSSKIISEKINLIKIFMINLLMLLLIY